MKTIKFEKPTSVEELKEDGNIGRFVIKPLDRGYGMTLGNSLRRVLLSSIPGAAIVNVKIGGVDHEFSTIPGVYEDVMEITLNLKKIIINVDSNDESYEQKLDLYVEGPTTVTAGDLSIVDGLTIINPDLVIATLAKDAKLQLTVTVRVGRGYVSANDNKVYSKYEVGVIPIDALYTPVKRVIYHVEEKPEQIDELVLEIETNGAIKVKEALALASKILVDYFEVFVELSTKAKDYEFIIDEDEEPTSKKSETKIEQLDLSVRLYNALKRYGITTIGELLEKSEQEIMRSRGLGTKSFRELKEKLAEHGLSFDQSLSKRKSIDFDMDDKED